MTPTLQNKVEKRVSEKWRDWSGLSDMSPTEQNQLSDVEVAEFEQLMDDERLLEHEATTIGEFIRHPGWQLMENFRLSLISAGHTALERLSPDTDAAKIRDIQAELRILRKYENFVLSKITALS